MTKNIISSARQTHDTVRYSLAGNQRNSIKAKTLRFFINSLFKFRRKLEKSLQ